MSGVRRLAALGVIALFAATPASAQEGTSISVFGFGGMINSPTDFDVDRDVSYDAGIRLGGGIALQLYEQVAVRGDFSFVSGSGQDTSGGINEDVSLDRMFYSGSLELQYPLESDFTPYAFLGGGVVTLDRKGATATSYAYDLTEFTGLLGVGARYGFSSNLEAFVEGVSWIYNRAASGDSQTDMSLNVGIGYRFPL
jgi:hypothetical protein